MDDKLAAVFLLTDLVEGSDLSDNWKRRRTYENSKEKSLDNWTGEMRLLGEHFLY